MYRWGMSKHFANQKIQPKSNWNSSIFIAYLHLYKKKTRTFKPHRHTFQSKLFWYRFLYTNYIASKSYTTHTVSVKSQTVLIPSNPKMPTHFHSIDLAYNILVSLIFCSILNYRNILRMSSLSFSDMHQFHTLLGYHATGSNFSPIFFYFWCFTFFIFIIQTHKPNMINIVIRKYGIIKFFNHFIRDKSIQSKH